MQANPGNFQATAVGERIYEKNLILKISGTPYLNFDQHISNLRRKADQQLNVLKRLSPLFSRFNKLTIFYTFILSNLITVRLLGRVMF